MLTRRDFLVGTTALAVSSACARPGPEATPALVNDVHGQLSATRVRRVARPASEGEAIDLVGGARAEGAAISIAGGRHAMGGQQFGADTILIDTTGLDRVLRFDGERGEVEVEAGIQWPALIEHLLAVQRGRPRQWGIVQKQTGADRLCLGGALAANIHGRGLRLPPFINDVEAFTLVDGDGNRRRCSRSENADLFRLAIGGYGLLGLVTTVTLRLARRRKLRRVVEVIDIDALGAAFDRRIANGFLFGDFQYATDPAGEDFLRKGVFSCYRPVEDATPIREGQRELSIDDWDRLLYLSHTDKRQAFERYAAYYASTSGQIYWSDTQQLSVYVDDYHRRLDQRLGATDPATEAITEIYVPRRHLARYLEEVRKDCRDHGVNVIYGTIRLIERDDESVLAWAREPWACIIFNLHVVHTPGGLERAGREFRGLIERAIAYGGSYYLTYHRLATRRQVEACHPRFVEFLRLKRRHDPAERFQSEWYRHYRAMFADAL